jgi:hypothetical protein
MSIARQQGSNSIQAAREKENRERKTDTHRHHTNTERDTEKK